MLYTLLLIMLMFAHCFVLLNSCFRNIVAALPTTAVIVLAATLSRSSLCCWYGHVQAHTHAESYVALCWRCEKCWQVFNFLLTA